MKTRMQIINPHPQAIYSSVVNAFSRITSAEGFSALWRGVGSMVLGAGPSHALYFATYEHCKELFGANQEGHRLIESGKSSYNIHYTYECTHLIYTFFFILILCH